MRINRLKIFFILPIIFLPFRLFATIESGGVENIFSYGVGLRAIGMGGAFTAVKEDATLAYWNPGAMAFNQYKEFTLFGTRTIADTYYFAGFYTHPTMDFGTLSVGGLGLYTGGIQSYDEDALPITGVSTDYFHYQVLLSYGYNFDFGLGVGAAVKLEQMTITEYTGAGGSFDLGVYYNPEWLPWLSVGAVVQDVIGTGIQIASEIEQNTRIYKLGTSATFGLGEEQTTRLIVALDGRFYWDNYNPGTQQFLYDFSLGGEVSFNDIFMVRAGYRNFSFDSIFQNLPAGLSVGVGIRPFERPWDFTFDYAVSFEDSAVQGVLDLLMQIGLSYRFGKSVDEQKKEREEKAKEEIAAAVRETTKFFQDELSKQSSEYDMKIDALNAQNDAKIEKINEEYSDKIAALTMEGKEKEEAIARVEKEREDAIARAEKEREDALARAEKEREDALARAEKEREDAIKKIVEASGKERDELLAMETFKSEQYSRGVKALADGNYQNALEAFEKVAEVDSSYLEVQDYIQLTKAAMVDVRSYPPEILNLYNRGVALFVQKKYEEAIIEWKKILAKDRYNKLAIDGIKQAEDRLKKLRELGAGQ